MSDDRETDLGQVHLAIVGVARNCGRSIQRDLKTLAAAAAGCASLRLLVVESDSSDDTAAQLQRLKDGWPQLDFKSLGDLRGSITQRSPRVAHCRNACLDELASNPLYAQVTHVLVADLDGVCRDLTRDALASCFHLQVPWDACFANQGDYYYDIWALRHPVWCPGDAWMDHEALLPLLGETEANNVSMFSRMVHIPRHFAPIEVHSAFGGLGLYQRDKLLAARYVGQYESGREICEHVTLHAQMRAAGARLFIHPGLITAQKTDHAGRKKFFRTLRRRLWNGLRGRGFY